MGKLNERVEQSSWFCRMMTERIFMDTVAIFIAENTKFGTIGVEDFVRVKKHAEMAARVYCEKGDKE